MKKSLLYIAILSLLFSSCTIEDEVTELTSYDDFLVQTRIVLTDPAESYRIKLVLYETDGYNNLTATFITLNGSSHDGIETFSAAVKEYREVGLKIEPLENIDHVTITFYELGLSMDPYFQPLQESGAFTLMYDFETDTHEIIRE